MYTTHRHVASPRGHDERRRLPAHGAAAAASPRCRARGENVVGARCRGGATMVHRGHEMVLRSRGRAGSRSRESEYTLLGDHGRGRQGTSPK